MASAATSMVRRQLGVTSGGCEMAALLDSKARRGPVHDDRSGSESGDARRAAVSGEEGSCQGGWTGGRVVSSGAGGLDDGRRAAKACYSLATVYMRMRADGCTQPKTPDAAQPSAAPRTSTSAGAARSAHSFQVAFASAPALDRVEQRRVQGAHGAPSHDPCRRSQSTTPTLDSRLVAPASYPPGPPRVSPARSALLLSLSTTARPAMAF